MTEWQMAEKGVKQKRIRVFVRIILLVLVGMVLGSQIYAWNAKSLAGDDMPMPFGFGASVVLSGSMEPELQVNDLILVSEQETYTVGDVVVYQSYGSLIVHRIIAIDAETVVTQGDANDVADEPVALENIKGKVVGKVPFLGLIMQFLKTPIGILVLIGGAVLLLELSFRKEKEAGDKDIEKIKEEIRKLQAEQKKQDEER